MGKLDQKRPIDKGHFERYFIYDSHPDIYINSLIRGGSRTDLVSPSRSLALYR